MKSRKEEIREYYKQIKNCYFKDTLNAISRNTKEIISIIKSDAASKNKGVKYVRVILQELLDYAKWNVDKWDDDKTILALFPDWGNEKFKKDAQRITEFNQYLCQEKKKSQIVFNNINSSLKNELL
tara:strand:- start:5597 stop:5974 length:378 start_codon:yes stop_codon:yes gene_type:complete